MSSILKLTAQELMASTLTLKKLTNRCLTTRMMNDWKLSKIIISKNVKILLVGFWGFGVLGFWV